MISICPKCRSYKWNNIVEDNYIICPDCGKRWSFIKKPLYIITGCSGAGKTTVAQTLQKLTTDYVVLDADIFYNIMPHENEEDYLNQIEQIYNISKNITQCQKSVIWTMTGNIDKLFKAYNARFFDGINVLAIVCSDKELRKRMTEGRKITDENWICDSSRYNSYLRTHNKIGDVFFQALDTDNKTPRETAESIIAWINSKSGEML
ncbi:MAG: AAA family ATPase [Lachnospiraceae bacterium]